MSSYRTTTTVRHPDGTAITVTATTAATRESEGSGDGLDKLRETLFFSTTPCAFKETEGSAFDYATSCAGFPRASTTTMAELGDLRRQSIVLKPDGIAADDPAATLWRPTPAGAEALVLDAVPVLDLILHRNTPESGNWCPAINRPLVKCSAGDPATCVHGYASGVRSALVQEEGKSRWYRLKGCGNNADGFPIVPVLDDAGAAQHDPTSGVALQKIRGACYVHTATLELHMSARVDQLLSSQGMRCANRPVGWWEYATPGADYPQVVRCCGLFECEGDRRLGDHVLRGLELLLPLLCNVSSVSKHARTALIGSGGMMPRSAEALQVMDADVQSSIEIALVCSGGASTPPDIFANMLSILDGGTDRPTLGPPPAADFPAARASLKLRPLWERAVKQLQARSGTAGCGVGELLAYLYYQFGRECGIVGRSLHNARIVWGTYRDSSGYHCNAHANNLVLRRPGGMLNVTTDDSTQKPLPFLMPCDFDMAFTEDSANFGRTGAAADQEVFEQYLEQELQVSKMRQFRVVHTYYTAESFRSAR